MKSSISTKRKPQKPNQVSNYRGGKTQAPYFGMFGKVFLAFMAEEESDRILRQHSLTAIAKRSITDIGLYKAQLCEVREEGYAFDNEGAFDGISGIASPIWDAGDNVVAAVGVGFISSSEDDVSRAYIIESVKEAARYNIRTTIQHYASCCRKEASVTKMFSSLCLKGAPWPCLK